MVPILQNEKGNRTPLPTPGSGALMTGGRSEVKRFGAFADG
jgi:hypothetical protein